MSEDIYKLIEKYSDTGVKYLPKELPDLYPYTIECDLPTEEEYRKYIEPYYTRGKDHHWWGKKHSAETKKLMSEKSIGNKSKTGRTGKLHPLYGKQKGDSPQSKKAIVNGIVYNSCAEAAEAHCITRGTFSYWIKTGKAIKLK